MNADHICRLVYSLNLDEDEHTPYTGSRATALFSSPVCEVCLNLDVGLFEFESALNNLSKTVRRHFTSTLALGASSRRGCKVCKILHNSIKAYAASLNRWSREVQDFDQGYHICLHLGRECLRLSLYNFPGFPGAVFFIMDIYSPPGMLFLSKLSSIFC